VSAVIYAAIVVMWAVVLVPMWLKRHDAKTESQSVDRFSTAMRTLSRRTSAAPGRRYVVTPTRGHSAPVVHVSGAAAPRPARPTRTRASIVARRRRALLGLSGAAFLSLVLTVAGAFPWPVPILLIVVLSAFCAHLRVEARRAAAVSRQRRRATVATRAAAATSTAAVRTPAQVHAAQVQAAQAAAAADPAPAAQAPAARQMLVDERPAVAVPVAAEGDEAATWQPIPVPRPTYAMKPPAPAFEADPTYAPPIYDPAAHGVDPAGEDTETDLDEILARRWAVND
jgi:hypothetical protein